MRRFFLMAAAAVVLVQAIPRRASADAIQYESLDLAVMNSDLVVRGQVIDVVSKKGDDGFGWNQVTVRVKETIKGEKFKEVKFFVAAAGESVEETPGTPWRNRQHDLLFCLSRAGRNGAGFDKADFVLHVNNFSWAVLLNDKPGNSLPIYSLDFKALTDAKEILTAARAAAEDRASKPGAQLEWGVPVRGELRPHTVLYPDSARVRAAAKKQKIELGPS